jgi:hypothetical protein
MGWFDSVCSSIGSFVSGAVSVVSSAVGSIGSVLATSASTLLKIASPYLATISTIVQIIGAVLNILKPEESVDEIGDKAMSADKQVEDFNTTEEYIEYLRDEVSFNKDEFDKLSKEDKIARTAVGTSIVMKAIDKKKGVTISTDTWITLAKLQESGNLKDVKEFDKILDTFKDNQIDLKKYVDGKLDGEQNLQVGDKLIDMYQTLEPNLSKEHIEKKVMNMELGE